MPRGAGHSHPLPAASGASWRPPFTTGGTVVTGSSASSSNSSSSPPPPIAIPTRPAATPARDHDHDLRTRSYSMNDCPPPAPGGDATALRDVLGTSRSASTATPPGRGLLAPPHSRSRSLSTTDAIDPETTSRILRLNRVALRAQLCGSEWAGSASPPRSPILGPTKSPKLRPSPLVGNASGISALNLATHSPRISEDQHRRFVEFCAEKTQVPPSEQTMSLKQFQQALERRLSSIESRSSSSPSSSSLSLNADRGQGQNGRGKPSSFSFNLSAAEFTPGPASAQGHSQSQGQGQSTFLSAEERARVNTSVDIRALYWRRMDAVLSSEMFMHPPPTGAGSWGLVYHLPPPPPPLPDNDAAQAFVLHQHQHQHQQRMGIFPIPMHAPSHPVQMMAKQSFSGFPPHHLLLQKPPFPPQPGARVMSMGLAPHGAQGPMAPPPPHGAVFAPGPPPASARAGPPAYMGGGPLPPIGGPLPPIAPPPPFMYPHPPQGAVPMQVPVPLQVQAPYLAQPFPHTHAGPAPGAAPSSPEFGDTALLGPVLAPMPMPMPPYYTNKRGFKGGPLPPLSR